MPNPQSALTRALTGKKLNGQKEQPDGSTHSGSSASVHNKVPRSVFPCLYQEGGDSLGEAADLVAAEIDEDVSASYRRTSVDTPRRLGTSHRGSLDEGRRWLKLGSPNLAASFMGSKVGSLPAGMSPADRLSLASSTPASLITSNLASLPPEKLRAPTTQGRKLRRTLLKGSVAVIVVAGYEGKRFIYERMKELGIRLVVIDTKDTWAHELVEAGTVDKLIQADLSDHEHVFDICMDAISKVEQELGQVDAVLSFWELSQPLVSRLAEHLNLPCNPPSAVDIARDKQRTREVMKEAGLPTPANAIIRRPSDLAKAARAVGFPAVIKPTSGAASLGVIRVDNEPDLHRLYKQVCMECASVARAPDGGLQTRDVKGDVVEEDSGEAYVAQTFIMEQYLDGPEVDVDLVVSQGNVTYGAITDNWPTLEPYFNETGSNCPSNLPRQQQIELCELAVDAVKALGFHAGVLHAELKFTSRNGPQLIEVNARMGGGPVHMINQLVWGVDLVEEQCLASMGIPSQPYTAASPLVYLAENSINAKVTGRLEDDSFMEEWADREDVVYARPLVHASETVTCVADGLPTWVAEVMSTKPTLEAAVDFVVQVEKRVDAQIRITPDKSHIQQAK